MLKEITHDGYLFRQMNVLDHMPIFELTNKLSALSAKFGIQEEGTEPSPEELLAQNEFSLEFRKYQLELLKVTICDPETKKPIGDEGLREVGFTKLQEYWPIVQEVNDMGEKKGDGAAESKQGNTAS